MLYDHNTNIFRPKNFHLTLFRIFKNQYFDEKNNLLNCDF
jgi:hypothetical protein